MIKQYPSKNKISTIRKNKKYIKSWKIYGRVDRLNVYHGFPRGKAICEVAARTQVEYIIGLLCHILSFCEECIPLDVVRERGKHHLYSHTLPCNHQ